VVGLGEEFKYHLMNWSKVCTPISMGGLKVMNLMRFNHALLGKCLWRYELKRETWWSVVVDSKYGSSWGEWCSIKPIEAYGVKKRIL
jgi:hypothetical protein